MLPTSTAVLYLATGFGGAGRVRCNSWMRVSGDDGMTISFADSGTSRRTGSQSHCYPREHALVKGVAWKKVEYLLTNVSLVVSAPGELNKIKAPHRRLRR